MDLRADLPAIQAPTLVIFGESDLVTTPEAAEFLATGIHGSRTLALSAAHLSAIEAADAFTAGVLAFLQD